MCSDYDYDDDGGDDDVGDDDDDDDDAKEITVAHPSLNMLSNNNSRHAGDAHTCLYLDGCVQSAPQLPETHVFQSNITYTLKQSTHHMACNHGVMWYQHSAACASCTTL